MKTQFACSRCGEAFVSARDLSGLRVKCRTCGLTQGIPAADVSPATAPPAYELAPAPVESSLPAFVPGEPAPSTSGHSRRATGSPAGWANRIRPWVFETSRVQGIGTWLVILSSADLLMTFVLLRRSPAFFESNPVAHWFFSRWNMAGMVFFKFSIVGGVILLSEIIERHRPGWGRFVLFIGCVGAAYAVLHGVRLYVGHDNLPMAAELD